MQRYAANWPRHPLPDMSAAKFYDDLKHLDAQTVTAAVESLFRSGREFPPTSAHILAEIAEQTVQAPPFREAWELLLQAIRRCGSNQPELVVQWLAARNPAVADWAGRCDIRLIGLSDEGDTTMYAQARQHYENVVRHQQRALTHAGLPPATVHQGLRPAGSAVAELTAALTPEDEAGAA
jgi:hypothetical protein